MDEKSLIRQPIVHLGFSKDFLNASKIMEVETIADVLAIEPLKLVDKKGFNYNWLCELSEFLNKHHMLHLLQPAPGKSHSK